MRDLAGREMAGRKELRLGGRVTPKGVTCPRGRGLLLPIDWLVSKETRSSEHPILTLPGKEFKRTSWTFSQTFARLCPLWLTRCNSFVHTASHR